VWSWSVNGILPDERVFSIKLFQAPSESGLARNPAPLSRCGAPACIKDWLNPPLPMGGNGFSVFRKKRLPFGDYTKSPSGARRRSQAVLWKEDTVWANGIYPSQEVSSHPQIQDSRCAVTVLLLSLELRHPPSTPEKTKHTLKGVLFGHVPRAYLRCRGLSILLFAVLT